MGSIGTVGGVCFDGKLVVKGVGFSVDENGKESGVGLAILVGGFRAGGGKS